MLILPALLAAVQPTGTVKLSFSPPVRCNATGPCPPVPPSPAPSADDEGSGELGAGPIGSACTVTAGNLAHIKELSRRDPVLDSHREIRRCLPVREVPEGERWRRGLLDHLLQLRSNTSDKKELVKLVAMISSLCSM